MSGMAIWITGLPGSGKSTIADAIVSEFPEFIVLRMDELRKIVTPDPTYSDTEREIVYRSLVYIAKKLSDLGHDVIIDATANFIRWRKLARQLIPGYMEVYLKCPVEICMEREKRRIKTREAPKDIYKKGAEGWPVPGVAVPYEEPENPEITIETDKIPLDEIVKIVANKISKLRS